MNELQKIYFVKQVFLLTSGNICSVHINMLRHARNYTIDILFWVSGFELFVHGIVIPLIIS